MASRKKEKMTVASELVKSGKKEEEKRLRAPSFGIKCSLI
jgi:hypothetical protein